MLVRKNISLDEKDFKKLEPLIEKQSGNFSAAIRDAIELTDVALEKQGSLEQAVEILKCNQCIADNDEIIINRHLLDWLLKNSRGRIPKPEIVNEFIDSFAFSTIDEFNHHINEMVKKYNWQCQISITSIDTPELKITVEISDNNNNFNEFIALNIVLFLASWEKVDIENIYRKSRKLTIDLIRTDETFTEIPEGIKKHFGYRDPLYKEINNKYEFWNRMINEYIESGYNIVALPKDQFEGFIAGEIANGVRIIESKANRPIDKIDPVDLFRLFKEQFSVYRLVNNIEVNLEPGNETLIVHHDYRNERAISAIIRYFSSIFEASGHRFNVTHTSTLIIFERLEESK